MMRSERISGSVTPLENYLKSLKNDLDFGDDSYNDKDGIRLGVSIFVYLGDDDSGRITKALDDICKKYQLEDDELMDAYELDGVQNVDNYHEKYDAIVEKIKEEFYKSH
jgi:hypothetical protein